MSTKLPNYLWPRGRSTTEPELMPNVLDSDGESVFFTSTKRKTTEGTVVDLGESPNSNNGDPLRTAFAKINNFIEATYWWDEGINQKFRDIDSELREGIFIYTDSDERYNVSLLDRSSLRFTGTPNNIEVSASRTHSPNNPHDFDSEVFIKFQLTETVNISKLNVSEGATFDSDVSITGNLTVGDDITTQGKMYIRESLTVDSDVRFGADVHIDSDVIIEGELDVGDNVRIQGDFYVKQRATFDSDVMVNGTVFIDNIKSISVGGTTVHDPVRFIHKVNFDSDVNMAKALTVSDVLTVEKEVYFKDDVFFRDGAEFDSDVIIRGGLTVLGTTTTLNTQNLEVEDPVIVLGSSNNGVTDTGIIFQMADSDNVVAGANTNKVLYYDAGDSRFVIGTTSSTGIDNTVTVTDTYMTLSDFEIVMYDDTGNARVKLDRVTDTLTMFKANGDEPFRFEIETGVMTGDSTGSIDGGAF